MENGSRVGELAGKANSFKAFQGMNHSNPPVLGKNKEI